jgi:hypothetical protein
MKSLWFVVPVNGRLGLAALCLRQLRRTCDALIAEGVAASAVVIASAAELDSLRVALRFGFATVARDNDFLGRRFNDGIQLATDARHNPHPADYVVPCGSDDWVDHRLFLDLPPNDTIVGWQRISFVSEDAGEISTSFLGYRGGSGIRIIPRALVAELGYRPADEDRKRCCDTSILRNLSVHHGDALKVEHRHLHDRQIVDWKTPSVQLNSYREVTFQFNVSAIEDPFQELADVYPAEALDEMRAYYGSIRPRDRRMVAA